MILKTRFNLMTQKTSLLISNLKTSLMRSNQILVKLLGAILAKTMLKLASKKMFPSKMNLRLKTKAKLENKTAPMVPTRKIIAMTNFRCLVAMSHCSCIVAMSHRSLVIRNLRWMMDPKIRKRLKMNLKVISVLKL